MSTNYSSTELSDRAQGCILAGAIGDAMGGPFEGRSGPLVFRDHTRWSISDDTQLTLATCESITETGDVRPDHIAARFLIWYRDRRVTGMGSSTLKSLRDLDAGAHWALAGAKGERSAGNGAAMRIAPLAFLLDPAISQHRQTIRDVSRITHHNDEAYIGALALMAAIRAVTFAVANVADSLLMHVWGFLPDSRVRDKICELSKLPKTTSISEVSREFGSTGYVVESVPLAIFAAQQMNRLTLLEILRELIQSGGDTDTIASMSGQIIGASIGRRQIPRDLIELLPDQDNIERIVDAFALAVRTGI
ncbi:MAG: ADP-ribosylglycohydrolase family protein [Pyrinomonadaceae bacterium]